MKLCRRFLYCTVSLLSGCSLLFDAGSKRSPGPTAPTVRIVPTAPSTLDDLHVEIVVPSIDAYGGSVTYEYDWRMNGNPVEAGTVVPSTTTNKGEVWEVVVTPVADRRRGRPAVTNVTIANSPPTLRYVGLFTHDPFDDDVLEAHFGPTTDADGDSISRRVEWFVDGVVVANHASQLVLAEQVDV